MKIVYPTWFELQFNDNNGRPLSSGRVYTKRSDSGANAVTYNANDAPNSNPVLLDSNGRAVIRLDSSFAYKFIVHDSSDVLVYERDKVYGTEVINTGTSTDHDDLDNRDLPDQHPITAITGLETALSAITSDVSQLIIDVTNLDGNKVYRSGDTMTGGLDITGFQNVSNNPSLKTAEVDSRVASDGSESAHYVKTNTYKNLTTTTSNSSTTDITVSGATRIYERVDATKSQYVLTSPDGSDNLKLEVQNDSFVIEYNGTSIIPTSLPPDAHASTHGVAGSDPITIAQSQVTDLVTDLGLKAPLANPNFTGVVTATGSAPVADFIRTSTDTNQLRYASLLTHSTTADMVDGFGVQKAFLIKDSAGVANVIGALGFRRAGADNTGEWVLTCINAGSSVIVATANNNEFALTKTLKYTALKGAPLRINSNTTLSGSVKNITFYGSTAGRVIDIPLATGSGLEITVRNIASVPVTLNFVGSTFYGSATFVLDPNETIELFDDASTLWI